MSDLQKIHVLSLLVLCCTALGAPAPAPDGSVERGGYERAVPPESKGWVEPTGTSNREASIVQEGEYLSIAFNELGTLSDGSLALSFDQDGGDYLPPVRMLVPETALERFVLEFSFAGETTTLVNTSLPGEASEPLQLVETQEPDAYSTSGTLSLGPLTISQTSRFAAHGRSLELMIQLENIAGAAVTDIVYMRAANPDPDSDHQGVAATEDNVYSTLTGDLAVASGPETGLSLGLGVLDATAAVGFCYRCIDPSYTPLDSDGRTEDWDLQAVVRIDRLEAGETVSFIAVYLAGPSPEQVISDWESIPDRDGDGFSGLEGDCDDTRDSVYPGATELCDYRDQDCDGTVDEGTDCYDDDQDGFSEEEGDCDDTDASFRPNAPEGTDTDGDGRPEGDGLDNNCDGRIDDGTDDFDEDGDGISRQDGDCLDLDGTVYPGATEVPYDGVDQDCDGTDADDLDGDGFPGLEAGGTDCDDQDSERYPGHDELANGIDDDCDGLIDEPFVSPGDVLLTEVLANPEATPDRYGEYLEIFNRSEDTVALSGWSLANAMGQRHVLEPSRGDVLLPSNEYLLLGINADPTTNGGVSVDYGYADLTLDNNAGQVSLVMGNTIIASIEYGGDTDVTMPSGASLQLDSSCLDEVPAPARCWCGSRNVWAPGSDYGTPGIANEVCPLDQDKDGWVSDEAGGRDCDDDNPAVYPGAPEDGGAGDGLADGLDNDCDGVPDNGTLDVDGDGDGFSNLDGDCDDDNEDIYPDALEIYDGLDNDCDGAVDPDWSDQDEDGYTPLEGDCDDANPLLYPGADIPAGSSLEPCDDPGGGSGDDRDGDGYTTAQWDCDDQHEDIYPGAPEICGDGIDQNCDRIPDDGCDAPGCGCRLSTRQQDPPLPAAVAWIGTVVLGSLLRRKRWS